MASTKQRPRVVHCKREPYDIYIGRPSEWGNPFHIDQHNTREQAIEKFRAWVAERPKYRERARQALRGKVLGCWCAPKPCHGDVLLEVANADE